MAAPKFSPLAVDRGDGAITGHGAGDQLAPDDGILQTAPVDRGVAVAMQPMGQLRQERHLACQLAVAQMGRAQVR